MIIFGQNQRQNWKHRIFEKKRWFYEAFKTANLTKNVHFW